MPRWARISQARPERGFKFDSESRVVLSREHTIIIMGLTSMIRRRHVGETLLQSAQRGEGPGSGARGRELGAMLACTRVTVSHFERALYYHYYSGPGDDCELRQM
jgi:hypothetical protein